MIKLDRNSQFDDIWSVLLRGSFSYARQGRMAVNIPLACVSMLVPDNCTNSRIQSMAIACMSSFGELAWFTRMFVSCGRSNALGSLRIVFRNSVSNVSHLKLGLLITWYRRMLKTFEYIRPLNLYAAVVEHLEQAIKQIGQIENHLDIRYGVQHRNPWYDELARKRVLRINTFTQHWYESFNIERRWGLNYNVLKEGYNMNIAYIRQFALLGILLVNDPGVHFHFCSFHPDLWMIYVQFVIEWN